MKKYNWVMVGVLAGYLCLAIIVFYLFQSIETKEQFTYKVEVNEIMEELEAKREFLPPDLHDKQYIRSVSFLSEEEAEQEQAVTEFYGSQNGVNSLFKPLVLVGKIEGYIRFNYVQPSNNGYLFWITEGIIVLAGLLMMCVLFYLKSKVINPFIALSEMPYELSKGHLQGDIEESKNRFFGKFIWGISMLRDTLGNAKAKELSLEKDKKMLLLSISHDIKIPLSAIKLYAKALGEDMYPEKEQRAHAAVQIENHVIEIEKFVSEIMTASSEDILSIEVENSEFYLKDYIEKIKQAYELKFSISLTEFAVERFENKLLKGDKDRAFEVMENLLENAFKYGDGKKISIDFYEEEYCQIITVYNSGIALPAEEMPHIFDSFYRGSNSGDKQGNGLGLYINRQIMRKMDGEIYSEIVDGGMLFGLVFSKAL